MLHAALRNNLGTHVQQKGSLVAPDRLRFDFSHHEKVTDEELATVATEINKAILKNYAVRAEEKSQEQAREEGAMAYLAKNMAMLSAPSLSNLAMIATAMNYVVVFMLAKQQKLAHLSLLTKVV